MAERSNAVSGAPRARKGIARMKRALTMRNCTVKEPALSEASPPIRGAPHVVVTVKIL